MKCAILTFTGQGFDLAEQVASVLRTKADTTITLERCPRDGLAQWTSTHFSREDALVFIGSVGIAVRAIAPHIISKTSDPAVVVIDEQGHFAVSVLAGHIGGANALTRRVATIIGATPVITTATDARGLFAVDDWAARQGLRIVNPHAIKAVSAGLLAGHPLRLVSDIEIVGDVPAGVEYHLIDPVASTENDSETTRAEAEHGTLDEKTDSDVDSPAVESSDDDVPSGCPDYDVVISSRLRPSARPDTDEPTHHDTEGVDDTVLRLIPPIITAGVGTRRGVAEETIAEAVDQAMRQAGHDPAALAEVASIDLKADEPGLLALCADRGVPLRTFTADQLAAVDGDFTPSSFVATVTGVDNVCERSAVAASGGRLLTRKASQHGVTVALARRPYVLHFDAPSAAAQIDPSQSSHPHTSPVTPDPAHSPRRTS